MTKEILHMRIDKKLKDCLRDISKTEHRNLSNLVEKILKDYIKDNHR